ncbi:MAG: hypothetical protein PHT75_02625 [Bacilli bacterium]|nr:hypothetical protein [Bacilli bacterium]MDD3305004.1 hypothetical protein [Bacilli bacterium]MDD4053884.1 hypothetical protein [Bacilli bacterium]MDD4411026.1 hypothetical protein [Bacilli bacterium]
MKEATGELNMTVITVIAIAAIGAFLAFFLPGILDTIQTNWEQSQECLDPRYCND